MKADILSVEPSGVSAYPYLVKKLTNWGFSDGTLAEENPADDETEYTLIEQRDQVSVYRKKEEPGT